jgi:hypothetical protein
MSVLISSSFDKSKRTTHGNIIKVLVVSSVHCLGPCHLRQIQVSSHLIVSHTDSLRRSKNGQEPKVLVAEGGRGELPRSVEPRSIGVTSTKGVDTGQSDNFLIVEAHSVEDDSEVILSLIMSLTLVITSLNELGRHLCISVALPYLGRAAMKSGKGANIPGRRPSVNESWCSNPSVHPSLHGI